MLPSENVDILYRRSCILEHIKAYFEGFFFYILQRLPRRYILFFKCKLCTKNKVKDN